MPLVAYQYNFLELEGQSSIPINLSTKDHQCISEILSTREWMYLRYADHCDFFMVPAPSLSQNPSVSEIYEKLRQHQILPGTPLKWQQMTSGKNAIFHFLKIATGIHDANEGNDLLALLHNAYLTASQHDHLGPLLSRLFYRGIWLHEKARQETEFFRIARTPEMVLKELGSKILGSLSQRVVCISGFHPLTPRFLEILKHANCAKLIINAPAARQELEAIKSDMDGTIVTKRISQLPLMDTDIVLLFPSEDYASFIRSLKSSIPRRAGRPLLIFDYASDQLLRDKSLKRLNHVYIYTANDLETVIRLNTEETHSSAAVIKQWIDKEVRTFYDWLSGEERFQFSGIIGATSRMQRIFELISRISRNDITILIDGESGTGKELVARAIHRLSHRASKPFKPVNCGAIPENLLESELFGHVRGAFTGAVTPKQGLFETANTGTIFLDEIADLPPHLQVKLLRFLQNGEIKRVGSNDTIRVNVRVLAATNKDLARMVQEERFRSDLYYRLNVIQLTIPPLRTRVEDIPLLVNHFLKKFSTRMQKNVVEVSPGAMQFLRRYPWPGNVRELENAIEHSVALTLGKSISDYDLPPHIRKPPPTLLPASSERRTLKELEKHYILETLEACNWNYELASKQLAIGRTTLWRKLREYKVVDA